MRATAVGVPWCENRAGCGGRKVKKQNRYLKINHCPFVFVVCFIQFMKNFVQLLTYLCLPLPVRHRPSTTPRHRTLFWAALVIPVQLVPCCFSSASVSRLQYCCEAGLSSSSPADPRSTGDFKKIQRFVTNYLNTV